MHERMANTYRHGTSRTQAGSHVARINDTTKPVRLLLPARVIALVLTLVRVLALILVLLLVLMALQQLLLLHCASCR